LDELRGIETIKITGRDWFPGREPVRNSPGDALYDLDEVAHFHVSTYQNPD
jgi:hypothetical protein